MRLYIDIAFYTGISKEHKLPSFAEISIQFKRLQTYNLTKFDFELCINDMIKELEQIRKLGFPGTPSPHLQRCTLFDKNPLQEGQSPCK